MSSRALIKHNKLIGWKAWGCKEPDNLPSKEHFDDYCEGDKYLAAASGLIAAVAATASAMFATSLTSAATFSFFVGKAAEDTWVRACTGGAGLLWNIIGDSCSTTYLFQEKMRQEFVRLFATSLATTAFGLQKILFKLAYLLRSYHKYKSIRQPS